MSKAETFVRVALTRDLVDQAVSQWPRLQSLPAVAALGHRATQSVAVRLLVFLGLSRLAEAGSLEADAALAKLVEERDTARARVAQLEAQLSSKPAA